VTAAAGRSQRTQLAVLTAAKVVSNTALRWVGPFLPTLERAFSATTGTLTGIMGASELAGLSTIASGPWLDRGHERRIFVLGLAAVGISSTVALIGTVPSFAVAFVLLVLGVGNLTVAGHTWIGHRVAFSARGRAIGVFETSWAIALLVGAPVLALLIDAFGWRGPFVALALASFGAALAVRLLVAPGSSHLGATPPGTTERLPRTAWFPMLASATTASAGLGTFVVSGAWLDDRYGISTSGLGVVAAGFGAIELAASTGVATIGDRIGSRRSVLIGLGGLLAGLAVMATAGDSRTQAIGGLLVFLAGFEFAFVSSLTLVTEAAPLARGRAIGISNACGTVARATAVVTSGQLYEAFGISGSISLAATAATAAVLLTLSTTV
jgi:predicted MFS family arabinose efflux permease